MAFKKRKKPVLGLDIGSSYIKYSILDLSGNEPVLTDYGITELSDGSIADGEIMDRLALVETVKSLLTSKEVKVKEVSTGLLGRGVIVKKIKMDQMKESELNILVKQEAENNIPYGIEDVQIDYKILGPSDEEGKIDVLLVAAKKEILAPFIELIKEIELVPAVIDVPAFAIQNCFELNYEPEPGTVYALVHIGYETTILSFIEGEQNLFTRDVAVAIKSTLQKIPGATKDQIDAIFRGEEVEGLADEVVKEGLESFFDELAVNVERAIPFTNRDNVDKIVLSGGGSNAEGIVDFFNARFETETEKIDPFKKIKIKEGLFALDEIEKVAPLLVLSLGLSLRSS